MRKMIPIILYIALGLIVILVVVIALQPAEFSVTRSTSIAAPPATIFAQVNEFQKWRAWSPWEGIDPNLKRTYEGPPAGVGSVYRWSGNAKVGEGSMIIDESKPGEFVRFTLEFLKPFKGTNHAEFTFVPNGRQTKVIWSMSGRKNFITKAFGLFVSMDKMIGGEFEKGLAQLKTISEKA